MNDEQLVELNVPTAGRPGKPVDVLVTEMEAFAAAGRYWDMPIGKGYLGAPPGLRVALSASSSFLVAVSMSRTEMLADHPGRASLSAKVLELDVDCLIALKRAWLAVMEKRPARARKLFQQAKALRALASASDPEVAIDPRSRGGTTTAMRHRLFQRMVGRSVIDLMQRTDLCDEAFKSHTRFAAAIQHDLASFLLVHRDELPDAIRRKVQVVQIQAGRYSFAEETLVYVFGLIGRMLKPTAGPHFGPVRAAYQKRRGNL